MSDEKMESLVRQRLEAWIAAIDRLLSSQLNEILHHPEFQRLEASWRGLLDLVRDSDTGPLIAIRVLAADKQELLNDVDGRRQASALHDCLHRACSVAGEPYSILVGDYEFGPSAEDVRLLNGLAKVGEVAQAPFIAAASVQMFGLDNWPQIQRIRDLGKVFDTAEHSGWRAFRESLRSRWTALILPRVLGRSAYGQEAPGDEFCFQEEIGDHRNFLWINAAFAYATRLTNAFARHGWLARIRGPIDGVVRNLPTHRAHDEFGQQVMKCPSEVWIKDRFVHDLHRLGFIAPVHRRGTNEAVFFGSASCHEPGPHGSAQRQDSAALGIRLDHLLCAARFAHAAAVHWRSHGRRSHPGVMQRRLQDWLNRYILIDPDAVTAEDTARWPLWESSVQVRENNGVPGGYEALLDLRMFHQLTPPAVVGLILALDWSRREVVSPAR